MENNHISNLRNDYRRGQLDREHVHLDPVIQFGRWMEQAIEAGIEEPTAMVLATASAEGVPSARVVLLKGFNEKGFTFFTNYNSRKGLELGSNPNAALVFFWKELERQVRIEGSVEKVSAVESDEYFSQRPKESQVGAIISPQSTIVPDRQFLEERLKEYLEKNKAPYARPGHWGGFRLKPVAIEFWQGRPGRLHDRIRYTSSGAHWHIERLAP